MLYYCPLERHKERYTLQWAAPKTGWLERNWIKHDVSYRRIDTQFGEPPTEDINVGVVLDPSRRIQHTFMQVNQLVRLAVEGELSSDDVIYFDDFWHPGIEALPYTFDQLRIKPKMYAFCHAQSVDEYDFTFNMAYWMRPFEQGIGKVLRGIFVNSDMLKSLLVQHGIGNENSVHVTGHVFCEEEVKEHFPKVPPQKENRIVFSSRFDREKNPYVFMTVMDKVLRQTEDTTFVICTGSSKLRSNMVGAVEDLHKMMNTWGNRIELKEGLTKEQYYYELLRAKVQLSTSSQDWVSFVLLEGSAAGCYPVYPYMRSFPQALKYQHEYMYTPWKAADKILAVLSHPCLFQEQEIERRAWIHRRHNSTWARMTNIMLGKYTIPNVESYE